MSRITYIVTLDKEFGIPFPVYYSQDLEECKAIMTKVAKLIDPNCLDKNGDGLGYFHQTSDTMFIVVYQHAAMDMLKESLHILNLEDELDSFAAPKPIKEYEFKVHKDKS